MKFLSALLLLVSFAAQANYLDATVAMKEVLPVGIYSGVDEAGSYCSVKVEDVAAGVRATAVTRKGVLSRVVPYASEFRFRPGTREFLSTEKVYGRDRTQSVEEVLRTIAVDQTRQYVVVAKITINNREVIEEAHECIINL